MLKKLTLMAVSVAALLAFAAPAAHATGALLTDSEGKALGVGSEIVATSTNTKTVTTNGTLECSTVILNGKINSAPSTTVRGTGTGEAKGTVGVSHTGHCAVGTNKVHILAVTISDLHLTNHAGGTTGTADFTYTYEITPGIGGIHCTFEGKGATVTRTGANTISVSGTLARIAPSSAFCPSTGEITGDFTVRDTKGNLVTIH